MEHACQGFKGIPIIFSGIVIGLDEPEITSRRGSYSQTIHFHVDESFKGTTGKTLSVLRIHVGSSCPSSTPELLLGHEYLVWAGEDNQGNAVVSDCTPTRSIEDSGQLISELRELRAGGGPTYIFGEIYRTRMPPNGARWSELEKYSSVRLPGKRVIVSSDNAQFVTTTDDQGAFIVNVPRGGKYRVTADLPSSLIGHPTTSDIELGEHECADASIWAQYEFRFSGRVVDTRGVPLNEIPVELISADTFQSFAHTFTDESGKYTLSADEPGKYLIAANWDEPPSKAAPFSTTFYPGVTETALASIVETQETGDVELADLRVPQAVACTIGVRVEDDHANLVKDAQILSKYFPDQFWHPLPAVTGPMGVLTVSVFGPSTTYLVASRGLSGQQEQRSEVTEIRGCPNKPLTLRLTHIVTID
jgi:hypothetical protein